MTPDCDGCNEAYQMLRSEQQFGTSLDIYFVGSGTEGITRWAKKMAINPERVKDKTVTLNLEGGMYAQYNQPVLPAAFYYKKTTKSVHLINLAGGKKP